MVRRTLLHFSLSWTTTATIITLLTSSCGAKYLRETIPIARELQSLPSLDDIILSDSDLTTMAAAFETAELVGILCTTCNFTAFAPSNDAFAAMDQTFLATLLTPSWILHLQNLLAFHITLPTDDQNRVLSTDFVDGQMFEMLNSEKINATVLNNGITLTSNLTVIGSKIIEADILASNGALHKVDTVLSPGFFGVDVFALGDSFVVEFTILQELMDLIGLAGTEGEYTVLAPTNDAFIDLGNETLTALKGDKDALGKILANHIIVGVFPSMVLDDGYVLESLGGLNITVTVNETLASQQSRIVFNGANTMFADILAKNGIVYAIDKVLMDADSTSDAPSTFPSEVPSDSPSDFPSSYPTISSLPSDVPSTVPSSLPSTVLSQVPSSIPSDSPSDVPSSPPSQIPSNIPSQIPSNMASSVPSSAPSDVPSNVPSTVPSSTPSDSPSDAPSAVPSASPSSSPSAMPTSKGMTKIGKAPSDVPSASPSSSPSNVPASKGMSKIEKAKGKRR